MSVAMHIMESTELIFMTAAMMGGFQKSVTVFVQVPPYHHHSHSNADIIKHTKPTLSRCNIFT